MPKDDIQAFKIINDLVYKNEFEVLPPPDILERPDLVVYTNDMVKKLLEAKFLSRKDAIEIMKLIFKDSWNKTS